MDQNSPFNTKKPKPRYKAPVNFIEALKQTGGSIAKDTAKGITNDLVGGVAKQGLDSIFGTGSNQTPPQETNQNYETLIQQAQERERLARQHQNVKQEYERQEVEIFNQRQIETGKKIEAIQTELKSLATEVVNLDQSTQAAIEQEITDPGTYHVNFFESLLNFVRFMRKKVVESRHWANLHSKRSQSKSYYWKQSGKKQGGTKFMLSHERTIATQTG